MRTANANARLAALEAAAPEPAADGEPVSQAEALALILELLQGAAVTWNWDSPAGGFRCIVGNAAREAAEWAAEILNLYRADGGQVLALSDEQIGAALAQLEAGNWFMAPSKRGDGSIDKWDPWPKWGLPGYAESADLAGHVARAVAIWQAQTGDPAPVTLDELAAWLTARREWAREWRAEEV